MSVPLRKTDPPGRSSSLSERGTTPTGNTGSNTVTAFERTGSCLRSDHSIDSVQRRFICYWSEWPRVLALGLALGKRTVLLDARASVGKALAGRKFVSSRYEEAASLNERKKNPKPGCLTTIFISGHWQMSACKRKHSVRTFLKLSRPEPKKSHAAAQ